MRWIWKPVRWVFLPFSDSFRLIELLAIVIAITAFFMDLRNRQEEREGRAWQVLTTKAVGNSGKVWALEYLSREERWSVVLSWRPDSRPRLSLRMEALDDYGEPWISRQGSLEHEKGKQIRILLPKWWPLNKDSTSLYGLDLTPPNFDSGRNNCVIGVHLPKTPPRTYVQKVEIPYADLSHAKLACTDFREAYLRGTVFSFADLRGANLSDAYLGEARLMGADLRGVDFRGTDLWRADIRATAGIDCAALRLTKNWRTAYRDERVGCGAVIPY